MHSLWAQKAETLQRRSVRSELAQAVGLAGIAVDFAQVAVGVVVAAVIATC